MHLLDAFAKLQFGHVQPPFLQTRPFGHTAPHAPQLLASVPTFTSQPFLGAPSQSKKPTLHFEIAQPAFTQLTDAFGMPAHGDPHEPQFFASESTLVSQ